MTDFVWPSDRARAESPELNRVCEYLEEILDRLEPEDLSITPDTIRVSGYSSNSKSAWVHRPENGVRIIHLPTGIEVTCDTERSQHKNRHIAMTELQRRLSERAQGGQPQPAVPEAYILRKQAEAVDFVANKLEGMDLMRPDEFVRMQAQRLRQQADELENPKCLD